MRRMSSAAMIGLSSALSWGLGLIVTLALIAVIATVVRKHRPDAAPILLGAVIFELLISIGSYAMSVTMSRILGTSGYVEAQALNTLVAGIGHAGARTLLLWGIVRLAQPPGA